VSLALNAMNPVVSITSSVAAAAVRAIRVIPVSSFRSMMNLCAGSLRITFANVHREPQRGFLREPMLSNAVTNAQKQIEGKNFDTRKNLKDYDDVLAKQRDIIYKKRDSILMAEDIVNLIHDFFKACGGFLAKKAVDANSAEGLVSGEQLKRNWSSRASCRKAL
jgi:preprotein translocase subunit SecA